METRIFANVIGDMRTDQAFSLALEADPWLALACRGLIDRSAPDRRVAQGALRPVAVGRGQWRQPSAAHRQAA